MFPIEEYRESAELLRKRLRKIRRQLETETDPERVFWLKRRQRELTPMMTQMNELVWLMEHFYESGFADRDERYGFNGKRKMRKTRRNTDGQKG